jgi:hypothetical protein
MDRVALNGLAASVLAGFVADAAVIVGILSGAAGTLGGGVYSAAAAVTGFQMRRGVLGKSSQTLTPQKCEPSVQMGVVIPARRWQGGPM